MRSVTDIVTMNRDRIIEATDRLQELSSNQAELLHEFAVSSAVQALWPDAFIGGATATASLRLPAMTVEKPRQVHYRITNAAGQVQDFRWMDLEDVLFAHVLIELIKRDGAAAKIGRHREVQARMKAMEPGLAKRTRGLQVLRPWS